MPVSVRETVQAVEALVAQGTEEASQVDLRKSLKLDKNAVSRRVNRAIDLGYLKNLEDKRGCSARLVLDEPLPDDVEILPKPADLQEAFQRSTVSRGETGAPLPPVAPKQATIPEPIPPADDWTVVVGNIPNFLDRRRSVIASD